nr:RNA-directed DNA polymerase [Actinomadura rayongensis]
MPLLTDRVRLKRCARSCMRRPTGPGADGVTWAQYRDGLDDRIAELAAQLQIGEWRPGPVRSVDLPSWRKELRLSIPSVADRIVHRALRTAAEPVLDADAYPPWLFGWRRRAGRVDALTVAARHLGAGRSWVADLDVAAATSGAHLDDAVSWLARWVHDGSFLAVVRRALAALPMPLAPGSGLTPMLTNLRLVPVDEELGDLAVVRVTDNYTVFCTTSRAAERAAEAVTGALAACGLRPNHAKSKVWRPNPEDLYLAG